MAESARALPRCLPKRGRGDDILFIETICNPKDSLALFYLDRVQSETRSALVQADAVRESNRGGNQEKRRLCVRGTL